MAGIKYRCDICNKAYDDLDECWACEDAHGDNGEPWSEDDNRYLPDDLRFDNPEELEWE